MKYDQKEKILRLSAEELVLAGYVHHGAALLDAPPTLLPIQREDGEKRERELCFSLPTLSCALTVSAPIGVGENGQAQLTLRFQIEKSILLLEKDEEKYMRALAYLYAYAFFDGTPLSLSFSVTDLYGGVKEFSDDPTAQQLEQFFFKLVESLAKDAAREVERVTERLPTFLSVPFPYGEAREGQKDMMGAVYTAAKQGQTLFAVAPTGTGKTLAVLFPAFRAMGAGHIGKIYYLTPKNTSARAAADAATMLAERGMRLRALHLVAKSRLCAGRREKGSCYGCARRRSTKQRMAAVMERLLSEGKTVVTETHLSEAAAHEGLCPYALAVEYAKYADLIICDYNYLFDAEATPHGFFGKEEHALFLIDEAHNLPDRAREMYSGRLNDTCFDTLRSFYTDSPRLCEYIDALKQGFLKTVDALLRDELRKDEKGEIVGFASSARFPEPFAALLARVKEKLDEAERKYGAAKTDTDRERHTALSELDGFLRRLSAYDTRFVTYAEREGERRRLCYFCIDPSECVCERLSLGRAAVFFSATLSPLDYYRSVLCGRRHTERIEVPSPFETGALCVGIMDKISVRASAREDTLPEIARVIITAMRPRRGNYMVFCPSYDYMERVAEAFHRLTPKTAMAVQKRQMTPSEREAFLEAFRSGRTDYFVGFCVSGGIFAEGIDLPGDRLIGSVVIGACLPSVGAERELIGAYYGDLSDEGKEYAYLYPGLNRILQAAGRVIRTEQDRGIVVLIDDRLRDPACKRVFPSSWRKLRYVGDRAALSALLTRFWQEVDEEKGES